MVWEYKEVYLNISMQIADLQVYGAAVYFFLADDDLQQR
jgi:hypothetical protein